MTATSAGYGPQSGVLMSLCITLHRVHIITLDYLIIVYLIICQGPLKKDNVTTVSKSFPQNVCSCFWFLFSWQRSFDIYCIWLRQQMCRETSKDRETLRWRIPSTDKHLRLCFVNDLVLSFPCRHVIWMQFFIPISTAVSSQRITLIEVKWEGACFSKEWMWLRRSETTVLNKWETTGPRPVITKSMNG